MVTSVVPWLVSVAVLDAPLLPTSLVLKFNREGESVTLVPIPLRLTTCGLVGSLSVTVMVPVLRPDPFGEKLTLTLQSPPGGIERGQLWDSEKSPAVLMLDMVMTVVPKFDMDIICAGLVVPTRCGGKLYCEGLTTGQWRVERT